jgi:hypothetical protein
MPAASKPDYTRLDLPNPHRTAPTSSSTWSCPPTARSSSTVPNRGSARRPTSASCANCASTSMSSSTALPRSGPAAPLLASAATNPGSDPHPARQAPVSGVLRPHRIRRPCRSTRIFFTASDFEAVVFAADAIPAERARSDRSNRPAPLSPETDAIPAMLHHMRQEMGARYLLLEGGAELNRALLEHRRGRRVLHDSWPRAGRRPAWPQRCRRRRWLAARRGPLLDLLAAVPKPCDERDLHTVARPHS